MFLVIVGLTWNTLYCTLHSKHDLWSESMKVQLDPPPLNCNILYKCIITWKEMIYQKHMKQKMSK